jgi:hypothetical protein
MSDDAAPVPSGEWNPFTALQNLTMERALDSTETPQTIAKRLFEEHLPVSVMAICHLATYSETEVIRFNAAKYVVERTMGPSQTVVNVEGKHAWDHIYNNVVVGAEEFLAQQGE